jgi:hypothetical protein
MAKEAFATSSTAMQMKNNAAYLCSQIQQQGLFYVAIQNEIERCTVHPRRESGDIRPDGDIPRLAQNGEEQTPVHGVVCLNENMCTRLGHG